MCNKKELPPPSNDRIRREDFNRLRIPRYFRFKRDYCKVIRKQNMNYSSQSDMGFIYSLEQTHGDQFPEEAEGALWTEVQNV